MSSYIQCFDQYGSVQETAEEPGVCFIPTAEVIWTTPKDEKTIDFWIELPNLVDKVLPLPGGHAVVGQPTDGRLHVIYYGITYNVLARILRHVEIGAKPVPSTSYQPVHNFIIENKLRLFAAPLFYYKNPNPASWRFSKAVTWCLLAPFTSKLPADIATWHLWLDQQASLEQWYTVKYLTCRACTLQNLSQLHSERRTRR